MTVISNKARSSHWLFNLTEEEMKNTSRMYKLDPACRNRWCLQSSPVPGSALLGMFWDNAPPPHESSSGSSSPLPVFRAGHDAFYNSAILWWNLAYSTRESQQPPRPNSVCCVRLGNCKLLVIQPLRFHSMPPAACPPWLPSLHKATRRKWNKTIL